MDKRALITGITGQDGSYLAEFLLAKGYEVGGLIRRTSTNNLSRIAHIQNRVKLYRADLLDNASIHDALADFSPAEVYNLAGQSDVGWSFQIPYYTRRVNADGAETLFGAVYNNNPATKVYQASSSEMFGDMPAPQSETTPFKPLSPYAQAKVAAHEYANWWRKMGLFVACGILFNHESPRRGGEFVTKKLVEKVGAVKRGEIKEIRLGNLYPKRDWGYAGEYVEAMWLMLQAEKPDDFVIATGESHSVDELVDEVCKQVGVERNGMFIFDQSLARPIEVPYLLGDSSKAKRVLGWEAKTRFRGLIQIMVEASK